jgi:hypothetical protein
MMVPSRNELISITTGMRHLAAAITAFANLSYDADLARINWITGSNSLANLSQMDGLRKVTTMFWNGSGKWDS